MRHPDDSGPDPVKGFALLVAALVLAWALLIGFVWAAAQALVLL